MTDKQIIIDGVPVQDCCYFDYENDGYEDSCYIHQNECSAQNCYYKQLKRKEQECEELKDRCKKYGEINEQETKDYAELKAELTRANCQIADDEILQCYMREAIEELKAENEELKGLNTRLDNQRETYWKGYQKLKATLPEIKFWARELLKRTGQVVPYEIKQILQKISECEGNDETN